MKEGSYQMGLSDLLDQDISSYEYFYSLPAKTQQRIIARDINSFEEMQSYVKRLKEEE